MPGAPAVAPSRVRPAAAATSGARTAGLDGIRGLAVGGVMLSHVGLPYIGAAGAGGVTVFFVLSGYLITGLLVAEHASTGRISLSRFWARRALRLLPALWLMVAVVGVVGVHDRWITTGRLAAAAKPALLYYADFVPFGHPLFMFDHTWSLAVEEQFYLGWPLVILLALRFAPAPRVAAAGLTVLAAGGAVYRLWLGRVPSDPRAYQVASHRVDACAWALLLGAALSFVVPLRRGHAPRIPGAISVAAIVAVFVLCQPGVLRSFPINAVTGPLLFGPLGVLLILAALGSGTGWLALGPLTWLGRRSYALYLWHFPLVWAVLRGPLHLLGGRRDAVLAVAVSMAVAEVSWWLVERPAAILRGRLHVAAPGHPASPTSPSRPE